MFWQMVIRFPPPGLMITSHIRQEICFAFEYVPNFAKIILGNCILLDSYIKTLLKTSKPSRFIRVNLFCLLLAYQTNKTDWKTI